MKIKDVKRILNAQLWTGEAYLERHVYTACGSDLMSDVLTFEKEEVLLLTGLTNMQVIETAEQMKIKVVVFVRGKVPADQIIILAHEKKMILLSTQDSLYTACGKLYSGGLVGGC